MIIRYFIDCINSVYAASQKFKQNLNIPRENHRAFALFFSSNPSMSKLFQSIDYIGGHPKLAEPGGYNFVVDIAERRIKLQIVTLTKAYINFENIVEIHYNEMSTRSAGKAAATALVGGVLTGGIGLIAGAAFGGRKRDASTIIITHIVGERTIDLILKAPGKTEAIYASVSAAISSEAPADFDVSRALSADDKPLPPVNMKGCFIVVMAIIAIAFAIVIFSR
jgi:hypothetical protein